MHGLHKGIQKRIEALERRLGTTPVPETSTETARRQELSKAALDGLDGSGLDLTPEEERVFEKALLFAPIFQELISEGVITPQGEPAGEADDDDAFYEVVVVRPPPEAP